MLGTQSVLLKSAAALTVLSTYIREHLFFDINYVKSELKKKKRCTEESNAAQI
jgi:hypothetical protein